jgi:hypothetical protein
MQNPIPTTNHNSNTYFLLAFGLINVPGLTLLFCTLGFLIGITISWWQFPAACAAALLINYYASIFLSGEKSKSGFLKNSVLIIVLLAASLFMAKSFYDVSFDGQWYHQETVYRLKQGFNPVYQNVAVPPDEQIIDNSNNWCMGANAKLQMNKSVSTIPVNLKIQDINYFSKGAEIIYAAIYGLTNRIESGKAANIIMLIASFFLSLSLLYKFDNIGVKSKWLLAFILAFNPIAIKELLTFCVDGFAASALLCLLLTFCLLLRQHNRYHYFLLACLLILIVNIKFTTLVYAGIYCIGFLLVLVIFKKTALIKKTLIAGIGSVFIGVFLCGFNPYVTNIFKKHNIFYGLDDTRAEIKRMTPTPFLPLNSFETLFLSVTAHQGWDVANRSTVNQIPKIPFTINKNDIIESTDVEPSISGFGPFFSGSMLVSLIIFFIALLYSRKTQAFKYAVAALLIVLSTVLIISDSWWSRFVPQLWLVPVIILAMAEFISSKANKPLKIILYLSLLLNIAWSGLIFIFFLFNTARINYQLQQLKALHQPVNIEFCNYRCFKSNGVRFTEAGIPLTDKPISTNNEYDVVYSTTRFKTAAPLPALPKSAVLRLAEKLSSK